MRSYSSAFIKILEILVSAHHYTIGDFLIEFFGSPPGYDQRATGRSLRHGKMLGMFMEGKTVVGVGEVLQEFHRAAEEFLLRDQCAQWTLAYPYQSLKPGYAALTSYAAQKVCHRLLEEQKAATNPDAGLHVFRPRKQGEEEIKLRLSWDTYGMNTLADIKAVLQEHQPLTFCYMFYLVHPEHHDEKKSQFRYGPPEVIATEVLCQINYAHNRNAKRLQIFNGILYYSSGASHTILGHTSRMGITTSYSNILWTLEELSKDEAKKLKAIGTDTRHGLDLVFDNVQTYAKQWEARIGRDNAMKVGMAATAVEINNFNPEAVKLENRRQLVCEGKQKKMALTVEGILKLMNAEHAQIVGALHWLQILTTYIPQLEQYQCNVREMFRTKPPANMRLDRNGVHKTAVHPLATSGKSETAVKELKDGLVDFLEQMGQTPEDYEQRVILAGGDGLTFEQMLNLKRISQTQDGPFKTFEILQPYLQLWHTEWTDLCRLFVAHFGEDGSTDPATIGHGSGKIGFKRPANLAKLDYYPASHHVYRMLDARVLDCWRLQFKTENLWTYFDDLQHRNKMPDLEGLFEVAAALWNSYSSPGAFTSLVTGHHLNGSAVPIGVPWGKEEDTDPKPALRQAMGRGAEKKESEEGGSRETKKGPTLVEDAVFQGDCTLARSASFMREALVSKEVAQAVAEGDVGRVYEGVKMMLVTFAGSSHSKYTNYLLDMISFLEIDAGHELRMMFLQNWLVNLSGEAGRYLEKDLMQEHYNEVLEERSKRQGMSWDSKQMRNIHSMTVQHVERIKKELRYALALSPKGWKHTKPHDRPEIKILLEVYRTTQLHTFRRGRQYRSSRSFVDEFAQGIERLELKLDKWKTELKRSDLMMRLGETEATIPDDELGVEQMDDGEEKDLVVGVAQTEGHCEFVDGELHMVDDEVGSEEEGSEGMDV